MLGVSRASAGGSLKRLEANGLIERGKQTEALLTPTGPLRAGRMVRRHRVIERVVPHLRGYAAAAGSLPGSPKPLPLVRLRGQAASRPV